MTVAVPTFSNLALLWPFANGLDRTTVVYAQYAGQSAPATGKAPGVPPNDGLAKLALVSALGHLAMDDTTPSLHIVGHQDADFRKRRGEANLIYIGGSARNRAVAELLQKCAHKLVSQFPTTSTVLDPPRTIRLPSHVLEAQYYDRECQQVRVDYGWMVLTGNPYSDLGRNALVVAGLHSYGTLAAAWAVSRPELSELIVERAMAEEPAPPHTLDAVEAVVRACVPRRGELFHPGDVEVVAVFVRGHRTTFRSRRALREARKPLKPRNDDSGRIIPMLRGPKSAAVGRSFLGFFADRVVIVVSPHSDDSALQAGGLCYYLRNRVLWKVRGLKPPPVHVLVVSPSPGGVPPGYVERLAKLKGGTAFHGRKVSKEQLDTLRTVVRHNEAIAEANVLGTKMHWIDPNQYGGSEETGILKTLRLIASRHRGRRPVILVPHPDDQHQTHRRITKVVLSLLRVPDALGPGFADASVWACAGPWAHLLPSEINVVVPLEGHAMFAKCVAMAMHRSQEVRTRFSDLARSQSRYTAESAPEMLFGHGGQHRKWDYVEVFQKLSVKVEDLSE